MAQPPRGSGLAVCYTGNLKWSLLKTSLSTLNNNTSLELFLYPMFFSKINQFLTVARFAQADPQVPGSSLEQPSGSRRPTAPILPLCAFAISSFGLEASFAHGGHDEASPIEAEGQGGHESQSDGGYQAGRRPRPGTPVDVRCLQRPARGRAGRGGERKGKLVGLISRSDILSHLIEPEFVTFSSTPE